MDSYAISHLINGCAQDTEKALVNSFATHTNPILLIDFAGQKIFESATVDTNILLFSKDKIDNRQEPV